MVPSREQVWSEEESGLQVKNDDFPFWHVKLEMTKEKSNGEVQ